jgi:hypothetical protein
MKVDATLPKSIDRTKDAAAELAAIGYDGLWVGETRHDPFLQLLQAADATEQRSDLTSSAGSRCRGRIPRPVCASWCWPSARSGVPGKTATRSTFAATSTPTP